MTKEKREDLFERILFGEEIGEEEFRMYEQNNLIRNDISLWRLFEKQKVSYYGIDIDCQELFNNYDDNDNASKCSSFIKRHFECGKKSKLLQLPFEEEYRKAADKHRHTVVLYLLGLCMPGAFSRSN